MANEITTENETLSALFDKGFALHKKINDSSGDQDQVRKAIMILEDATRLVSVLDIFSRNEQVKEVPNEHLKYFLLPVLLGDLQGKLQVIK